MPTKGFPVLNGKSKSNAEKLRAIEAELDRAEKDLLTSYPLDCYLDFLVAVRKILRPKEQNGS